MTFERSDVNVLVLNSASSAVITRRSTSPLVALHDLFLFLSLHPLHQIPHQRKIRPQITHILIPTTQLTPRHNHRLYPPPRPRFPTHNIPHALKRLWVMQRELRLAILAIPPRSCRHVARPTLIPHHYAPGFHKLRNLLACEDLRVPIPLVKHMHNETTSISPCSLRSALLGYNRSDSK